MVVANCNESCYWLHLHCSQWQLLLFLPCGIKIAFVAIWRVSCGELGYFLTRCSKPELVAKCEHILCMTSCELNEQQQSQNLLLKVERLFVNIRKRQRVDRAR